jgi:hypothetical protein
MHFRCHCKTVTYLYIIFTNFQLYMSYLVICKCIQDFVIQTICTEPLSVQALESRQCIFPQSLRCNNLVTWSVVSLPLPRLILVYSCFDLSYVAIICIFTISMTYDCYLYDIFIHFDAYGSWKPYTNHKFVCAFENNQWVQRTLCLCSIHFHKGFLNKPNSLRFKFAGSKFDSHFPSVFTLIIRLMVWTS